MWMPVVGFEGYEVSRTGRVRRSTKGYNRPKGYELAVVVKNGYRTTTLTKDRKTYYPKIAKLVAAAFIGPRPHGLQINHIDGKKHHDHANNLEYVTASENKKHAFRLGLIKRPNFCNGSKHQNAKLNERKVKLIRASKERQSVLAAKYGVSRALICMVKAGTGWTHVK